MLRSATAEGIHSGSTVSAAFSLAQPNRQYPRREEPQHETGHERDQERFSQRVSAEQQDGERGRERRQDKHHTPFPIRWGFSTGDAGLVIVSNPDRHRSPFAFRMRFAGPPNACSPAQRATRHLARLRITYHSYPHGSPRRPI